jgi:hypothetical protein
MNRLLILSLVCVLWGCAVTPVVEETCITVELVYEAVSLNDTFDVCGPTNLAADILTANAELLGLEITPSSFGDYVSGMAGFNFDTLGLNVYWAIFHNDEAALVGISELIVAPQDVLLFEATPY